MSFQNLVLLEVAFFGWLQSNLTHTGEGVFKLSSKVTCWVAFNFPLELAPLLLEAYNLSEKQCAASSPVCNSFSYEYRGNAASFFTGNVSHYKKISD